MWKWPGYCTFPVLPRKGTVFLCVLDSIRHYREKKKSVF